MYYYGDEIEQDMAEAFKWLKLSADQNDPLSQYLLGDMYRLGEGVEKNY